MVAPPPAGCSHLCLICKPQSTEHPEIPSGPRDILSLEGPLSVTACNPSHLCSTGFALQIQCYQCEEFQLNNDCSSPEFIVNCTVNVQDMCQKEVMEQSTGKRQGSPPTPLSILNPGGSERVARLQERGLSNSIYL